MSPSPIIGYKDRQDARRVAVAELTRQARVWDRMSYTALTARLPVLKSLLESQRSSLGDDDHNTLLTREQIAYCTGASGDGTTALGLYQQLLIDQERVFGPDHSDTLTSRHQVAFYTAEAGDPAAALALYGQVAADRVRVLGPDNPDTLLSRHAVVYRSGDPAAALALYRQIVAEVERAIGPDDRYTLLCRAQLAFYTGEAGDSGAGLEIAEDVLRKMERSVDLDSELLGATRSLKGFLELQTMAATGRPLPRELRELQEVLGGSQMAGM